ncbi:hypothetical protein [Blautia wexlerae]|uniref:hypothetical protein n=1 Tax=Blautia wexlerae TaxID=418240 RepID=UPI001FA812D7|nr:hypothetical protein [Blautia wexlerae]
MVILKNFLIVMEISQQKNHSQVDWTKNRKFRKKSQKKMNRMQNQPQLHRHLEPVGKI